jgi:AcrR family transcriptional regulator
MATTSSRTPRLPPEDRREQLLDCALDVLTEHGFGALNVEAVARRAGVTRPVVYDTFGDLGALVLALIDRADAAANRTLAEILGRGDPAPGTTPEGFLVDSVLAFLRAVKADPKTWRLVLMPPRGNSPELRTRIRRARREIAERVRGLIDWGVAARGGPAGLDHELLARLIVSAGEDAARLMLAHPRRFSPERLSAAARDLMALIGPGAPAGARTAGTESLSLPEFPPAPASTAPAADARRRVPQAERREQLLDVTLELLAEHGFSALSVEAIARAAGVNRVVVYRSFANLPVLLTALMRREDQRVRATLGGLIPQEAPGTAEAPAEVLLHALGTLLSAVVSQPQTWRVALLRPESAPRALQKIVNRRRAALASRIEAVVRHALAGVRPDPSDHEIEVIARMLLTLGEEQGRLALDDPEFPPERLLRASRDLLAAMALGSSEAR